MRATRRPHTVTLLALLLVATLGSLPSCGPAEEQGAEPVENAELAIRLAQVPAGFRVAVNEGTSLVLEHTDAEDPATLEVLVGPVETAGINLQEQVWAEKDRIEAKPGGDYKGQNELGGAALGTIYTSRGRFEEEDGEMVEEYRALAIHPTQNRLLILDYEYPPTERTGERLRELMAVIETIDTGGGS